MPTNQKPSSDVDGLLIHQPSFCWANPPDALGTRRQDRTARPCRVSGWRTRYTQPTRAPIETVGARPPIPPKPPRELKAIQPHANGFRYDVRDISRERTLRRPTIAGSFRYLRVQPERPGRIHRRNIPPHR